MSEHLDKARREHRATLDYEMMSPAESRLWRAMGDMLTHLEALEQRQPQMDAEGRVKVSPHSHARSEYYAPSSSAASSPTTERATTAGPLDAETTEALSKLRAPSEVSATASTAAPTPLSQRLRGVLTEAARIHVEQCSECLERLAQFRLWWEMPVQVAAGTTSTSVNQESKPSADSEGPVASPSSASSNVPIPWNHGTEQRFVGKPL